jgi:hypothetical protein
MKEAQQLACDNLLAAAAFQAQADVGIFNLLRGPEKPTGQSVKDIEHDLGCADAHRRGALDNLRELIGAVLALICISSMSFAEDVVVLIDDAKPATYLVVVADDGTITVTARKVVRPTKPVVVAANPFVEAIAKQADEAITAGATKPTAASLANVYGTIADQVTAGTVKPADAFGAIKTATDAVIDAKGEKPAWATFRAGLSQAITTLHGQGELATKEQVAACLRKISQGLSKAAN